MGEVRNFKFGVLIDPGKSQVTKYLKRGVVRVQGRIFKF